MNLKHPLFIDFKLGMRSEGEYGYRLDDGPYFITWPLVYVLKKTGVTPNQICLLSFLSGTVFLAGLLQNYPLTNHYLLILLLGLRILFDCIDGQHARYSRQTTNLGALYDLAADFVFTVLLFITLTYLLIVQNRVEPLLAILICLIAFLSFVVTATVHSYLVLLQESTELPPLVIKERFMSSLPDDCPQSPAYTRKLNLFNRLFGVTWRPVSLVVTSVLRKNIPQKNMVFLLHSLSLTEYGMHLVILWVIVLTGSPLLYFLIFEIILFGLTIILLSPYIQVRTTVN